MDTGMVEQVSSKRRIYNALTRRRTALNVEGFVASIGEGTKEIVKQQHILDIKVIPFFKAFM